MPYRDASDAIARVVAGASDRAQKKLLWIDALRRRSIADDKAHPGRKPEERKWPLHSTENRPAGAAADVDLEARASVARARARCGSPLDDLDRQALALFPDTTPYEDAMRDAIARYRQDKEKWDHG